jgi:hypothetical protein
MELGCLIEEAWHASHSTDDLTDSDFTELGVSVLFLESIEDLLLLVNDMFHLLLESDGELSLRNLYIETSLGQNSKVRKVI